MVGQIFKIKSLVEYLAFHGKIAPEKSSLCKKILESNRTNLPNKSLSRAPGAGPCAENQFPHIERRTDIYCINKGWLTIILKKYFTLNNLLPPGESIITAFIH